MRYWTLLVCACTAIALSAQIELPLIYYFPPTSGCNGVAAFLDTTLNCYQGNYTMTPLGCSPSSTASGDTIFFSICNAPCEVVMIDGWGEPCYCTVSLTLGSSEQRDVASLLLSRANGELVITAPHSLTDPWCYIYDTSGRTLLNERLGSGTRWVIDSDNMERFLIVELWSLNHVLVGRL